MCIDGNEDKFITSRFFLLFGLKRDHKRDAVLQSERPGGSHSNAKRVIEKKTKTSLFGMTSRISLFSFCV